MTTTSINTTVNNSWTTEHFVRPSKHLLYTLQGSLSEISYIWIHKKNHSLSNKLQWKYCKHSPIALWWVQWGFHLVPFLITSLMIGRFILCRGPQPLADSHFAAGSTELNIFATLYVQVLWRNGVCTTLRRMLYAISRIDATCGCDLCSAANGILVVVSLLSCKFL